MLTQKQLEEFKKQAIAKGYSEQEINNLIASKQKQTEPVSQTVSEPVAQKTSLANKAGGFLTNLLKSATKPLVDYGKFVGEAGVQGYRAVTDPTMRKATFQPNKMTEQDWISLGKLKDSFLVDPEEIKNRGQIALTGSKRTAGAAAYAIPGGQATALKRIGASGLSGLLSGYGGSEKGEEVQSTIGGGASGLVFGTLLEGAGSLGKWIKNKKTAKNKAIVTGSRLKDDPFWSQNLQKLQETSDMIGLDKNMPSDKKMSIINEAFGQGQDRINQILKEADPVDKNKIQQIANEYFSQIDVDMSKPSVKSTLEIAQKKLNDAVGDNVKLNDLKKYARGEMGNSFTKGGSNLTDKQKIWSNVFDTIKDSLDDVSPEVRAINNFQRDLFPLAKEFGKSAKKAGEQVSIKIPLLEGASIQSGLKQEGTQNALNSILGLPSTLLGGASSVVGKLRGAEGSFLNQTAAPVARNTILQNILGSGQQPQQPAQQTTDQQIPQTTDTVQQNNVAQGLGSVLTPEILSMALLKGEISSSDISALQSLGIIQAPEKSQTATERSASQAQQMAQQAYQMLQAGDIKTGLIGGPTEQLKAKVGSADQPTLDFNTTVGNIRGMITKARAGTALSKDEKKMLNTYVPKVGDSRQELETKLRLLQTDAGKSALQQLLTPTTIQDVQAQLGQ